jgi:hypothetical protein
MCGVLPVISRPANTVPERFHPDPNPGARLALIHLVAVDDPAVESTACTAIWTGEERLFDLQRLDGQRVTAMIAKPRGVADSGQTVRADRAQVLLVERKIGAAELATNSPIATGRSTRCATDDRCVVPLRLCDCHNRSAPAAEPAADRSLRRSILPPTGGTDDENSHDEPS